MLSPAKNARREVVIDPEEVLIAMARMKGEPLNGNEQLELRTWIATAMAAKKRHRQRMNSPAFEWKKPQKLR